MPMNRFVRARGARFAVTAGMLVVFAFFAVPAAAAVPCPQRILGDWSDNGRVDRVYELHCYEEAIDALPADLRDYTDATEVIQRAMTRAARSRQVAGEITGADVQAAGGVVASSSPSLPIAPLVGGGAALALVLAGGVAYVVRRRGAA
jgi:hypothetical protein